MVVDESGEKKMYELSTESGDVEMWMRCVG